MLTLISSLPLTIFLALRLMADGTALVIAACFVSLLAKLIGGGKIITRGGIMLHTGSRLFPCLRKK